jgi:hypothetical protein
MPLRPTSADPRAHTTVWRPAAPPALARRLVAPHRSAHGGAEGNGSAVVSSYRQPVPETPGHDDLPTIPVRPDVTKNRTGWPAR